MDIFVNQLRERLNARIAERDAARTEMDAVLAAPTAENRELNDVETAKFTEVRGRIAVLDLTDPADPRYDDSIAALTARVNDLAGIAARKHETATVVPPAVGGAKVKREARTYDPTACRRDGVSFFADVASFHRTRGVFVEGADQRIARHMQEERVERGDLEMRAITSSAVASLVVPQYLVDMYAPLARAGRPFADICNHHDLPAEGMTVEISRITTGVSAAAQATQNTAVSETNLDDTALSLAVKTNAGQQTVSRQALERGRITEDVLMGDLIGAYHTAIDSTLITEASTGLNAVTDVNIDIAYTDASPTAAELWPKLFDAIQQVQTAAMGVAQTNAFLMHPRRFWWLASQVGTNFPFVNLVGAGAQSGGSVLGTGYGNGPSGYLAGLPVYVDANVSTTLGVGAEDAIYVLSTSECHLWEDPQAPLLIRAEETNAATLGVLFVVYGYFAYTVSRYPSANGRINGTGLTTPTF